VSELVLSHPVGWSDDVNLNSRISTVRETKDPINALDLDRNPISVIGDTVLDGNGRVYALKVSGYSDIEIPVREYVFATQSWEGVLEDKTYSPMVAK
jgi:hypothetical protein